MASDPGSQTDGPLQVAKSTTRMGVAARERSVLSKAVGVHTAIHITQIWADRLHLTSIYASFFTTIDSLLFKLASRQDGRSLASTVILSSLAGALIFHAAAAALAYVGSLVLIRHRLRDAQAISGNPSPRAVSITADAESADPRKPEPTVATSSQTPSALGSRFLENVEHTATSTTHPSPMPATRILSETSTGVRSSLLSDITETLAAFLHHPAGLYIDTRRVSLFNLRAVVPCVADDADSNHDTDAQKNAIALAHLLSKCHGVCSCFVLVGFVLVITGVVACLWERLEKSVAIFGSVCVAVCLILGFGALH